MPFTLSGQTRLVVSISLGLSFIMIFYLTAFHGSKLTPSNIGNFVQSSSWGRTDIPSLSLHSWFDGARKQSKGVLVIAARQDTDVGWLKDMDKSWQPRVYLVDAPYAGEKTLTVPQNKGHEAMVYLTHFIDNYDNLPTYTICLHGHREAWHQESDIITTLRNIRLGAVDQNGYISLRCDWYPSCPAELRLNTHDAHVWGPGVHRQETEDAISSSAWQAFFPNVSMPDTIASQCCAQFIVTRSAVRRNDRQTYIKMRDWILATELHDDVSGRVLEKLWAYIMTGRPINCPSPHTCACEFFGKCEKKKWQEPPAELGPLPEDSRGP